MAGVHYGGAPKPMRLPTAAGSAVEVSDFRFVPEACHHPSNATMRRDLKAATAERRTGAVSARIQLAMDEQVAQMDEVEDPEPRAQMSLNSSTVAPHTPNGGVLVRSATSYGEHLPTRAMALRLPPKQFGARQAQPSHAQTARNPLNDSSTLNTSTRGRQGPSARSSLPAAWRLGRSRALDVIDGVSPPNSATATPQATPAMGSAAVPVSALVPQGSSTQPSPGASPGSFAGVDRAQLDDSLVVNETHEEKMARRGLLTRAAFANRQARAEAEQLNRSMASKSASVDPNAASLAPLIPTAPAVPEEDEESSSAPRDLARRGTVAPTTEALLQGDDSLASLPPVASAQTPRSREASRSLPPPPSAHDQLRTFPTTHTAFSTKSRSMACAPRTGARVPENLLADDEETAGANASVRVTDVGMFASQASGAFLSRQRRAAADRRAKTKKEQKKSRDAQLIDEADDFRRDTRAKLNQIVVRSLNSLAMVAEAKVFQEPDLSLPSRTTYPHMHSLQAVRDVPTDQQEVANVVRQMGEAERVDDNAPRWLRWGKALDRALPSIDDADLLGTHDGILPRQLPTEASVSKMRRKSRRRSSVGSPLMASTSGRRSSTGSFAAAAAAAVSPTDDPLSDGLANNGSVILSASGSSRRGSVVDPPPIQTVLSFSDIEQMIVPELAASDSPAATHHEPASPATTVQLPRKGSTVDAVRWGAFQTGGPSSPRPKRPAVAPERTLLPPGRRVSVDLVDTGLVEQSQLDNQQRRVEVEKETRFVRGKAKVDAAEDQTLTAAQRKIALIRRQAALDNATRAETEASEMLRRRGGNLFRDDELEQAVIEQLQAEADRYVTTYAKAGQPAAPQRVGESDTHTQRFEKGLAARRLMRNRKQVDAEDRPDLDWGVWRRAATRALGIGLNEITHQAIASRMQVQWITTRSREMTEDKPAAARGNPAEQSMRPTDSVDVDGTAKQRADEADDAALNERVHSLPCHCARKMLSDAPMSTQELARRTTSASAL